MKMSALILTMFLSTLLMAEPFRTITFPSKDGLTITADVYIAHPDTAPFIILFHQAGYSRGEYREIAPRLNKLGFNAMAIDQRSGDQVNGVVNQVALLASQERRAMTYLDALPDMMAAIDYSKQHYAKGKFILWGSSYSASLVLKIAGDHPDIANGVLAFSPGEYFTKLGKSKTYITESAQHITIPVFITSARDEKDRWWPIYQAIPSGKKTYFIPKAAGRHGSSALWRSTPGHAEYWKAVTKFMDQFLK